MASPGSIANPEKQVQDLIQEEKDEPEKKSIQRTQSLGDTLEQSANEAAAQLSATKATPAPRELFSVLESKSPYVVYH